jgi:hypothetical protein
MNDSSNPQVPDNAGSSIQLDSSNMIEPFGDWLVRITDPGCEDLHANVATIRKLAHRPLPQFE